MEQLRFVSTAVFVVATASLASAQWNPPAAQWGKVSPTDLRVMVWNVQDGICSTKAKVEGANNWRAITRIIASMKPDVLTLEETGDNSGNVTGTTVDTVAQLTTTIGYMFHGGNDSFNGNTPIIIGGDWNEEEFTNNDKGPAEWLANALTVGGATVNTSYGRRVAFCP